MCGSMMNPDYELQTESEEEDRQVIKLAQPSKNAVYDRDGLFEKLRDIALPYVFDRCHRLSIDVEVQEDVDVNDDGAMDLSFYMQAFEGVLRAILNLQTKGEPFLRPHDCYGEMVKPDTHMDKVKGMLLAELMKAQEVTERRKARDNKKLAMEVQAQKMKERAKQKKLEIESVKNWRKQSGFDKERAGGLDLAFDEDGTKPFQRSNKKRPGVSPGDRSGGKGTFGGRAKGSDKKRKSREFRDSKFGFGGRKGLKKQNTAETTNDFIGFHKGEFLANKKISK